MYSPRRQRRSFKLQLSESNLIILQSKKETKKERANLTRETFKIVNVKSKVRVFL